MSFSIVIPTRDRPHGLRAAVVSALASLREGGEVVVVDDGSEIPATALLEGVDDENLHIFFNPGPHGASAARNYGVMQTKTNTIFFLDDDDQLMPDYCCTVDEDILRNIPKIGFGFSTVTEKETKRRLCGILNASVPLRHCMAGLGQGFFIRRNIFLEMGGLDESIVVNEDTELCIRLKRAEVTGWASGLRGVVFANDAVRETLDRPSTTKITSPDTRALCFERIFEKHGIFLQNHGWVRRSFAFRILKYRLRERNFEKWMSFVRRHIPFWERFLLSLIGRMAFAICSRQVRNSIKSKQKQCNSQCDEATE